MGILKSGLTVIIAGYLTIFLFTFVSSVHGAPINLPKISFIDSSTIAKDTLQKYLKEANSLWNQEESDLDFSFQLLSITAENEATPYYNIASKFYFWSINNANFQQEENAIEDEVYRLLPLVPDSTQQKWKSYLNEKDPQLFREIIGFWEINDPFNSTQLNERLIEHWQRINYAKEHFKKASDSPYGTDERGTFYVRLGAPESRFQVNINLSQVYDPISGERLTFEFNLPNIEIEIWEYEGENCFFLFGHRNGTGRYGLRDDIMELVNSNSIRVRFRNSYERRSSVIKKMSKNALLYALSEELAPYHQFFQNLYSGIDARLTFSSRSSFIGRFSQHSLGWSNRTSHKIRRNLALTPATQTSQKLDNEDFSVHTNIFQFLDDNNENEYLFSLQPNLSDDFSAEPQYLSNKIYLYNNQWKKISTIDNLIKIEGDSINSYSFSYPINQSDLENYIYYSAELIDTSRSSYFIPTHINPQTSVIVKSTGKEKVTFPRPLNPSDSLLISDILVGKNEKNNDEASVPISPSLDMRYNQNENIMIYFETYNIPQEGYSFTYFFKKERWLFGPKKVEDKSEVIILVEEAKDRDDQFFSINLDDLAPGSYQLIFEFSPIDQNSAIEKREKTVSFEITE